MIQVFDGHTADEIWRLAANGLIHSQAGRQQGSRLGPIREYLHCSLHLSDPRQRWVLSRRPAMNPAFAIAELIWILLGRNDAGFVNYWNPALPNFAGHTEIYHGAYGYRLRNHFAIDQLERAYQALSANPDSRQVVLQIWDPQKDFPNPDGSSRDADIPCNIVSMPKIRDGKLEWLQVMRSNDLFLGTPHNFIQFTSLQEIIAGWLEVDLGSFVLVSDSLHIYEHDVDKLSIAEDAPKILNRDSLSLSKAEFDLALPLIGAVMDEFRVENLSRSRFVELIKRTEDLPHAWKNLLTVVGADVARRRSWQEEMIIASNRCANPMLSTAWNAWEQRCQLAP